MQEPHNSHASGTRCDEAPDDGDTAWIVDAFAPASIDVELDMIEASLEAVEAAPALPELPSAQPDLEAVLAVLRPLDVVIVIGDPEPRTIPAHPDDGDDVLHCEIAPVVEEEEPTLVPWSDDDRPTGARPRSEEEITAVRPLATALAASESARHAAARINAHVLRRARPPTPSTPPIDAARLPAPPVGRPRSRLGRGTARMISQGTALGLPIVRPRADGDELRFDRDLARARAFAEHSRDAKDVFPREVREARQVREVREVREANDAVNDEASRPTVEPIAVARRVAEPVPFPSRWAQLDPRLAAMLPPEAGTVERVAEHAVLDGRVVTRELVLVIADVDPLPAIERVGAEIARAGLQLEIDDHGIGAASPELCVRVRGDELLELGFKLVAEHDDVDLREEMMRCDFLRPLLPLAELGRFVTRVGTGRQLGRAPHAAMSIALDDETRPCLQAWLAARDYEAVGSTWKLCADGFEYVVAFERSEDVDEATAFVRPVPSRPPAPRHPNRDPARVAV